MAATAAALVQGEPLLVYALVTVGATSITLTRPVQSAFIPEIVSGPDELTAANVGTGIVDGAGALAGPLVAGVLLGIGGPALVFLVCSAGLLGAAIIVAPLARRLGSVGPAVSAGEIAEAGDDAGFAAGIRLILTDAPLRAVTIVLAMSMALAGAIDIFYAVLALDVFDIGDSGVGFLSASTGLGALIGSGVAVVLVGRERLGRPLVQAAALFGAAVAAVAVAPGGLAAAGLLVFAGIGSAMVYVAIQTLTQRMAGDDVMSRVFGIQEAVMMTSQSLGSLAVPLLLVWLSPSVALVVAGLALPAAVLLVMPTLLRADRVGSGHARQLGALRRVPMFMPLSAPVLEQLAAAATLLHATPGEAIVAEGDPGDAFYVIETGTVEVSQRGTVIGRAEAGESFGEIALVRDVPRTATVRAVGMVDLVVLAREPFLDALTGQPRSHTIAVRLADERVDRLSAE